MSAVLGYALELSATRARRDRWQRHKYRCRRVGDLVDVKTVVSDRWRRRILAMLERGKAADAKVLTGGGASAGLKRGFFIEPTTLYDVDPK